MRKQLTKKLLKQYETAADIPLLRASLQLIPQIGGALDVLIFDKAAKIKEKRLLDAIEQLKINLSKVSENLVDRNYIDSEEFLWLAEKIFTSIASETKYQKREYLKNMLSNSCKVYQQDVDKEILFHILDNTPTYYLVLLNDIKRTHTQRVNITNLKKVGYSGNLHSNLRYLASIGLLDSYIDVSVEDENDNVSASSVELFRLNKLGNTFLEFIQ